MADNIEVIDRSANAKVMAADEVAGVLYQVIKMAVGSDGLATFLSGGAGATDAGTLRTVSATDDPLAVINNAGGDVITTTIDRATNTITYSAGGAWANSTASPAVRTIAGASRGAGKSGIITDIFLSLPVAPGTMLTGELWIFDSAPTAALDNGAWALSDADLLKVVDVVEFTMKSTGSSAGNSYCRLPQLNIGFKTVSNADLYIIPKVTNAYVPSSGEVLTVKTKIARLN